MIRPARRAWAKRIGEVRDFLTHEGGIGGFSRHVAAHGSHGDPHVGDGQGRGVVDAIAHHGDRAVGPQTVDGRHIVFGEQFGGGVVTPARRASASAVSRLSPVSTTTRRSPARSATSRQGPRP